MANRRQPWLLTWPRTFCALLLIVLILPNGFVFAGASAGLSNTGRAVPAGPVPAADVVPAAANLVADPSFELGASNPYWTEYDNSALELICSTSVCGSGSRYGPHAGTHWARLGGVTNPNHLSEIQQLVGVPACGAGAWLQFYLWITADPGAGSDDWFLVLLDSTQIFTLSASSAGSYSSYTPVNINISSFADGNGHTLLFESVTSGQKVYFNIDDVALTPVGGSCPIAGNAGVAGSVLSWTDGVVKTTTADGSGNYSLAVPPGWSGIVAPKRSGYVFTPTAYNYAGVTRPMMGQNYTANNHPFADVPVPGKEWMESWIVDFYVAGMTTGCGQNPLIYCPENNVTRAEMAVFVLRARHGAGYQPPAKSHFFSDMPVAGKEWMEPWVDQYYREGLTTGCGVFPNGLHYCPENNVTRAEMAVFVLRSTHAFGWTPPPSTGIFADVPVTGKEWMQPWIEEYYREGITSGCNQNPLEYCPENSVTRAEMAVFIDRAYHFHP